jgi:parallel beta-helix repeat protein
MAAALALGGACAGDEADECSATLRPSADDQTAVQAALIEARAGDRICLEPGVYHFSDEVSLAVAGVTLVGPREAIWDFSAQERGANGLQITADRVTVEGFTIRNPKGDGVRASKVEHITLRGLRVLWERESSPENGGYGLYPVESRHVLVERNEVSGASDLGIYLGQSHHGIVRDNEVFHNVGGIEVENSTDVDIHANRVHDNASGIQVIALPELPLKEAARVRVFDNQVTGNNWVNFAPAGTLAALIPSGTGILILAADHTEVFANRVGDNRSFGIALASFAVTGRVYDDPGYDMYPEGNWIHDNLLAGNGTDPAPSARQLTGATELPDLVWDGVLPLDASSRARNCFSDNGGAAYLDFALAGTAERSRDLGAVTCRLAALPAVSL